MRSTSKREWVALILGAAALAAIGMYLGGSDPFCDAARIGSVLELGGCR
jgi:hypothetical protein